MSDRIQVGAIPTLARGVRFRRLADGQGVLLIPEGAVKLNPTAAAAVELLDGARSSADIAKELTQRFAGQEGSIAADVEALLRRLARRGWVFFSSPGAART